MAKENRRKLLFITVFLMILLSSSAYISLMPTAHAAQLPEQKGIYLLKSIVGIDLANYNVTAKESIPSQQQSFMGVIPQDTIAYNLTSANSKVYALCTFTNGSLQTLHMLQNQGSPHMVNSALSSNAVEIAKSFLTNYQAYTGKPLFGQLKSTLGNINASENVTVLSGDKVLEVNASNGNTNFKWYYSANGAIAPYSKFISIYVSNGSLTSFIDNWDLYNVGSNTVNLTKEQAVQIALATAINHTWSIPLDNNTLAPQNFNEAKSVSWCALTFDDSIGANANRSSDSLELYPVWRIGLVLNKWYGQMYGIEVDVWADSGQVRSVQEAYSTLPPPEDMPTANLSSQAPAVSEANFNLAFLIALPTLAAAVGATMVWMSRKKKSHRYTFLRRRGLKTGGILLCILISSTIALGAVAAVNATSRDAVIWGSRSSGAPNNPYSYSWRKTDTEIWYQNITASDIASDFANNGYTAYNHEGDDSFKGAILNDMSASSGGLQAIYDYGAFVDFDHGVGGYPGLAGYANVPTNEFHYMFEDDYGTVVGTAASHHTDWSYGVYDMDIYNSIDPNKAVFAFINTCMSADYNNAHGAISSSDFYPQSNFWQGMLPDGNARGMPYAFTHRIVEDPSTTGFNIASDISNDGYGNPDTGGNVYIGFPYGSASLSQNIPYNTGYLYRLWVDSFFWYALEYDTSVNQALDLASDGAWGSGNFGNSPLQTGFAANWPMAYYGNSTFYNNPQTGCTMAVFGNGNIHLKQYEPDYVSTPVVGGPTSGDIGTSYQFSASSIDPSGHNIRYTFDWGDGSSQTVTGWYSSGATAYANHTWSSNGVYNVTVRAQCDHGVWSTWSSPRIINIGNVLFALTVLAYNQYGYSGYVPLYIDGTYVGTTGYTYTVTEGTHTIYVVSPLTDGYTYYHVFQYYYYDGNYNYDNPMTLSVTADKTVTAYYYSYYA